MKKRIVVLASGYGSNLQAVLDACQQGELGAEVVAIISDQKNAYALQRGHNAGIPALHHLWQPSAEKDASRREYDQQLAEIVTGYQPDLVVLAGWMRILTMAFLGRFPNRVLNLHPALPGEFPGTHAIERAFEAFRHGKIQQTGVMVHFVPDEGVDSGPVILKEAVPICFDDTLESLKERVHSTEHRLLVEAARQVLRGMA